MTDPLGIVPESGEKKAERSGNLRNSCNYPDSSIIKYRNIRTLPLDPSPKSIRFESRNDKERFK